MIIEVDESFEKDFKKIRSKEIEKRIINRINSLEKAENLDKVSSIKPIKGFSDFYRIRIGDYRIGFKFDGKKMVLIRVRNRKDIYNVFP